MVKVKYFDINNVVTYFKSLGSTAFAALTMSPFYALGTWLWSTEMFAIGGMVGFLGVVTGILSKGWANTKFWKWK